MESKMQKHPMVVYRQYRGKILLELKMRQRVKIIYLDSLRKNSGLENSQCSRYYKTLLVLIPSFFEIQRDHDQYDPTLFNH